LNAKSVVRVWDRYWFAPGAAENLALVRIVCYSLCFLIYFNLDIRPWAGVSHVFWMPVSLFRLLSGPPQKEAFLGLLQIIWKLSLLTSAIGLASRASMLTAALLGFFVLGLPNCYGKILHLDGSVVLILAILAVSRCDEAFTVDRMFWKPRPAVPKPSGDFTWPLKIAQALFLLIFFAAGFAKLRQSGFEWVDAENMRAILISNFFTHAPPARWAASLSQSNAFCSFAACATLVVELSALPAIFLRVLRAPTLIALAILQVAISSLMGIYFVPYLVGYALFVPWQRLYSKLHA
jgi:hypothetical protein